MQLSVVLAIILPFFGETPGPQFIRDIPLPPGFTRSNCNQDSFCEYLRAIPLRNSRTVYLYNGLPKTNQQAQYAVADLPVGNEDLLQCADIIMMLRAKYLFTRKRYADIIFRATDGTPLPYTNWCNGERYTLKGSRLLKRINAAPLTTPDNRNALDAYLQFVYRFAGTRSLQTQLRPRAGIQNIEPGDLLLQGGSPGHAVLVADVAINNHGRRIYLLLQGYMPAQDIHLLRNPLSGNNQPWYTAQEGRILTPEWHFSSKDIYQW